MTSISPEKEPSHIDGSFEQTVEGAKSQSSHMCYAQKKWRCRMALPTTIVELAERKKPWAKALCIAKRKKRKKGHGKGA